MRIQVAVLAAVVLTSGFSCGAKGDASKSESVEQTPSAPPMTVMAEVTRDKASATAMALLRTMKIADEYLSGPEEVLDRGGEWHVWIKRTDWETVKPSRAFIIVSKKTGIAVWQPQK